MLRSDSVLLADDEATFLNSTAYLLRQEGYDCDCASDGDEAEAMLRTKRYDLLVADIHMPGNDDLELVRRAQREAPGMPVILVTGQPTLDSAVRSVQLPVAAYVTKPLDIEELKIAIRAAMEASRVRRTLSHAQERLLVEVEKLKRIEQWMSESPKPSFSRDLVTGLDDSLGPLISCFEELRQLRETLAPGEPIQDPCDLLPCPKRDALREAVQDAIDVIERTKNSFKSKELGALRVRLRKVLKNAKESGKKPRTR